MAEDKPKRYQSPRMLTMRQKGGRNVPLESRPFYANRELAVAAGRKGGSVKREREFKTIPGLAKRARVMKDVVAGQFPPKPKFPWKW